MRRVRRATAVALVVAGGLLAGWTAPAAADQDKGLLRLAHLSPDTPAVDVYVDSVADPAARITLPGVGYGTVSGYQEVPPGEYTVSMRPAGAAADTPPVLTTTVEVTGDSARTVAGVGLFAKLGLAIIDDSLATPPTGQARIRVLDGASNAQTVDVTTADGTAIAKALPFAATGDYVDLPAGTTTLRVSTGGEPPTELPIDVAPGSVYSLVVLNSGASGLTVRAVLDAASPGVVPTGGVETGAGGTAGGGLPGPMLWVALGAACAALAVGVGSRRRRVRRGAHRQ
jgi:hypothetical protein